MYRMQLIHVSVLILEMLFYKCLGKLVLKMPFQYYCSLSRCNVFMISYLIEISHFCGWVLTTALTVLYSIHIKKEKKLIH